MKHGQHNSMNQNQKENGSARRKTPHSIHLEHPLRRLSPGPPATATMVLPLQADGPTGTLCASSLSEPNPDYYRGCSAPSVPTNDASPRPSTSKLRPETPRPQQQPCFPHKQDAPAYRCTLSLPTQTPDEKHMGCQPLLLSPPPPY